MIEKNEDNPDSDNNLVRIRLIADKRTFLEKQFLQVQEEIKICFAHLTQTLHAREKQLLRQSEAIYRQQISLALSSQETLPPSISILDERNILEEQIKQFGRIELKGSNSIAITNLEPYKIVEYQDINKDHVSFDKSIKNAEIIPSNTKIEFTSITEDKNIENIANVLKTFSVANITEKSNHVFDFQETDFTENSNHSLKTDTELKKNDFNHQSANIESQEDGHSFRNSGRNVVEEQHNSNELPEQVHQWLDQIVNETEIEPTIHEVEKLPEILEAYMYQTPIKNIK